jgi:TRAP-type C4-dicarboxylate transport system permease small subunit
MMLKKLENTLLKIEKTLFVTILAVMVVILSCHVVMRYLFNKPLIWTDEVVTMMQGVIAFLGIGYCFHRGKHIELTLVYDRVPTVVKWLFDILSNSVMLVCTIFMVKVSYEYVIFKHIPLGTIPWLKQSYFYAGILVGFIVAAGYILVRLIKTFSNIIETCKAHGAGKE